MATREAGSGLDRFFGAALVLWTAATAIAAAGNAAIFAVGGREAFSPLVQPGPASGLKLTFAAIALVWLSAGLLLLLLRRRGFRARHGLVAVCCFLTLVLYANVLRERMEYPDSGDYMRAAFDLAEGRPLHERYIYPPLLAASLEVFAPLGRGAMRLALWTANLLAVAGYAGLLVLALVRYGFERRLAAAVTLLFVAVNVPVLRTLVYGQVNLHVASLVLLCLLLHPARAGGSALALALAVHLKTSPAVLALPFLSERRWRWLAAFAAALAAVAALLYAAHGAQPFLDFLRNTRGLAGWNDLAFRDNSLDSFLRATAALVPGLAAANAPLVRALVKAVVLGAALVAAWRAARAGCFAGPGGDVHNAWPALSIVMVLASPLVWEHHPVFLGLSFLVLLRKLEGPGEWAVYSLAYVFVFLLPTFDFYPWSYARLVGMLFLLGLLMRSARRVADGTAFRAAQAFAAAVPGLDRQVAAR
jgi:hypothetical protein